MEAFFPLNPCFMKNFCIGAAILIFLGIPGEISAQDHKWGIGLILGPTSGISSKFWLTENKAIDLALTWGQRYGTRYGGYDGVGYTNPDCYGNGFYRNNTDFCNDRSYRTDGGGPSGPAACSTVAAPTVCPKPRPKPR